MLLDHFHDKTEDYYKDYYKIVKACTEKETDGIEANVFSYIRKILPTNLNDQTVLDIGCGDARWSKYLCKIGARRVIGLDNNPDMIAKAAKNKINQKLAQLELIQGDMRYIPLKDGTIDQVLSVFSLMYFHNLESVTLGVSRALKNGGGLYVSVGLFLSEDFDLLKKIKGESVPLILKSGDSKIRLENNIIQTIDQYKEAFRKGDLLLKKEKYFPPIEEVFVAPDYKYKNIAVGKAVFFLIKK